MLLQEEILGKQLDELPVGIEHAYLRKELAKFFTEWKLLEEKTKKHIADGIDFILDKIKPINDHSGELYDVCHPKNFENIGIFVNLGFPDDYIEARKNIIKECKNFYEELSQTWLSILRVRKNNENSEMVVELLTFFANLLKEFPVNTYLRLNVIFQSYKENIEKEDIEIIRE